MALLTLRDVSIGFGGPLLLEQVDLQIERGERVCLIGRNGTGKSTLMQLICGLLQSDSGEVSYSRGTRIAYLSQQVPERISGSVFEVVAEGLGGIGELLQQYHHASHRVAGDENQAALVSLERIQSELETAGGWHLSQRVETVLSRLGLEPEADFAALSGGLKRRVLLAQALVSEPDLLLLDEPTNHLDLDAIRWLEEFLGSYTATVLFVTHDRMLLQKLATRILDLDRGRISSWPGDYQNYMRQKQALLAAEAKQEAQFQKGLAREEAWIRQGIKARRTRNQGRVKKLEEMRAQRRARRSVSGPARMRVQEAELSGKKVIEVEDLSFGYGGELIVRNFSALMLRGDRVGIIGANGSGKTTLLKLLLGDLSPRSGSVTFGTGLQFAYFDQHRAQLDPAQTVQDSINQGSEQLTVNGKPTHVIAYLQNFLFSPAVVRTPVKALSGGERNRLLLARLFAKPSNVLVLDEPTNDLDVETLELLEEQVLNYRGTVLLVSHDRAFINSVVTSTLVFEGKGVVAEYVGGYDDWLRQRPVEPKEKAPAAVRNSNTRQRPRLKNKLSYREQRELGGLPEVIACLESEQQELHLQLSDPAFYREKGDKVAWVKARLAELEQKLSAAYARWETLEAVGVYGAERT
ncbi:MAG: ATP-binding cassette domain-containing protein [Gammaproteobacteria bacterium]